MDLRPPRYLERKDGGETLKGETRIAGGLGLGPSRGDTHVVTIYSDIKRGRSLCVSIRREEYQDLHLLVTGIDPSGLSI